MSVFSYLYIPRSLETNGDLATMIATEATVTPSSLAGQCEAPPLCSGPNTLHSFWKIWDHTRTWHPCLECIQKALSRSVAATDGCRITIRFQSWMGSNRDIWQQLASCGPRSVQQLTNIKINHMRKACHVGAFSLHVTLVCACIYHSHL